MVALLPCHCQIVSSSGKKTKPNEHFQNIFYLFLCQLRDEELSKESQESNWFSAPSALRVYGEKNAAVFLRHSLFSLSCYFFNLDILSSTYQQASTWTWTKITMACWAKKSCPATAQPLSLRSSWTECFRSVSRTMEKWYDSWRRSDSWWKLGWTYLKIEPHLCTLIVDSLHFNFSSYM